MWRSTTRPGSTSPTLFEQWCGFFYVPQEPDKCKCCETGHRVFCPYPRRLESLLSSQLFKDPECWSGRGSNPWPADVQQTGALPTEPTRRIKCLWSELVTKCRHKNKFFATNHWTRRSNRPWISNFQLKTENLSSEFLVWWSLSAWNSELQLH